LKLYISLRTENTFPIHLNKEKEGKKMITLSDGCKIPEYTSIDITANSNLALSAHPNASSPQLELMSREMIAKSEHKVFTTLRTAIGHFAFDCERSGMEETEGSSSSIVANKFIESHES
jgi:hypothetical protein